MANFTRQLISTPQTLTSNWENLGDPFDIDTYILITVELRATLNDSEGVMIRAKFFGDTNSQLTKRIITTDITDKIIPNDVLIEEWADERSIIGFKVPDGASQIQIQVKANVVGATAGVIEEAIADRSYNADYSGEKIEITTIRTDTASNLAPISLNTTTSTTILPANSNRNNVYVSNLSAMSDIFIKLQPATTDNDKKGIVLNKNTTLRLFGEAVYTGEISAISNVAGVNIYVVEY